MYANEVLCTRSRVTVSKIICYYLQVLQVKLFDKTTNYRLLLNTVHISNALVIITTGRKLFKQKLVASHAD